MDRHALPTRIIGVRVTQCVTLDGHPAGALVLRPGKVWPGRLCLPALEAGGEPEQTRPDGLELSIILL